MSEVIKKVPAVFIKCDFCSQNTSDRTVHVASCVLCNRDICNGEHQPKFQFNATGTEDGTLCPECSVDYEIDEPEWGAVGVINKHTGRAVDAPYL